MYCLLLANTSNVLLTLVRAAAEGVVDLLEHRGAGLLEAGQDGRRVCLTEALLGRWPQSLHRRCCQQVHHVLQTGRQCQLEGILPSIFGQLCPTGQALLFINLECTGLYNSFGSLGCPLSIGFHLVPSRITRA